MAETDILYAVENGVATLTLNRPEMRTAFGDDTRTLLATLLDRAAHDPVVRCVIVTGAGEAFAAGGDIKGMAAQQAAQDTGVLSARLASAANIVQQIRALPKPVIAAVNGAAAGGGMNLALACDIRYCADSAIFSESFVHIGLIPDWGGHYLLTGLVGTARALELMMLGERIDAATALQLGLVNAVFPAAKFRDEVASRAARFAAAPRHALAAIKRGVYMAQHGTLAEILAFEARTQVELFLQADAREGMQAFLDKRSPRFTRG